MAFGVEHAHLNGPLRVRRSEHVAEDERQRLLAGAGQRQILVAVAIEVGPQRAVIRRERFQVVGCHVLEAAAGVPEQVVAIADAAGHGAVDVQIQAAVVIEIGERTRVVAAVDGDAPGSGDVLELSAAAIEEEPIWSVVRHEQIETPVVVDVGGARADGTVRRILRRAAAPPKTGRLGDIRELAGVVAIEPVGIAVHVAGIEIEIPVLVIVEPHGADGLARIRKADRRSDIAEYSLLVPEEDVRTIAKRHEQIEVIVTVEIDPRSLAHRSRRDIEVRRQRDIDESGITVSIET